MQRAIARGVSVYQGDIDQGLDDYPDQAFDYVILSQTLQEMRAPLRVLREMLRTGRHGIVAFPNFGHWSVRLAHLFTGARPKTKLFPHDWYDSPNIHFLTVHDFETLAAAETLESGAAHLSASQSADFALSRTFWPKSRFSCSPPDRE